MKAVIRDYRRLSSPTTLPSCCFLIIYTLPETQEDPNVPGGILATRIFEGVKRDNDNKDWKIVMPPGDAVVFYATILDCKKRCFLTLSKESVWVASLLKMYILETDFTYYSTSIPLLVVVLCHMASLFDAFLVDIPFSPFQRQKSTFFGILFSSFLWFLAIMNHSSSGVY